MSFEDANIYGLGGEIDGYEIVEDCGSLWVYKNSGEPGGLVQVGRQDFDPEYQNEQVVPRSFPLLSDTWETIESFDNLRGWRINSRRPDSPISKSVQNGFLEISSASASEWYDINLFHNDLFFPGGVAVRMLVEDREPIPSSGNKALDLTLFEPASDLATLELEFVASASLSDRVARIKHRDKSENVVTDSDFSTGLSSSTKYWLALKVSRCPKRARSHVTAELQQADGSLINSHHAYYDFATQDYWTLNVEGDNKSSSNGINFRYHEIQVKSP